MPRLKEHLQEEWDKVSKREKTHLERKRKREETDRQQESPKEENGEPALKRSEQETTSA